MIQTERAAKEAEQQERIKVLEDFQNRPRYHRGPVFSPDERILLQFGNYDYDILRQANPQCAKLIDLNEVKEDMKRMQEGMNKYGFTTDDLRKAENVDFNTMH